MYEDTQEAQAPLWEDSHPWLVKVPSTKEEEDSVDEMIRYSLDEIRFT